MRRTWGAGEVRIALGVVGGGVLKVWDMVMLCGKVKCESVKK